MRFNVILVVLLVMLLSGCSMGASRDIVLRGTVDPGQVSLDKLLPVAIEASVENVGNSTETIAVDVDGTEGLLVEKPERTVFTLKPGESRVVIFIARLEETAVPGKYRIEITAVPQGSGAVKEVVFIEVVSQRGFI
jgi:hypothetical protein